MKKTYLVLLLFPINMAMIANEKIDSAKEVTDYLWTADHVFGRSVRSPATRNALLQMGYQYTW